MLNSYKTVHHHTRLSQLCLWSVYLSVLLRSTSSCSYCNILFWWLFSLASLCSVTVSFLFSQIFLTHTRLTAHCPGLPRWAGTRKVHVKPIWILLKQEAVSGSGSGISWAICKSATRSRQIATPAPHCSVFTGWMPFLSPNQQRQSTEGKIHKSF